jgi:hypothetical protein
VLANRPVSVQAVAFVAGLATVDQVADPKGARWMVNPVSVVDVSVQVSAIVLDDVAIAERFVGALGIGAAGVVTVDSLLHSESPPELYARTR